MKKKKSITSSYFFIIIAISFITIVILGGINIKKQYSTFSKEIIILKNEYIEDQKIIIKLEINEAYEYIEWRRETAEISEKDLQNEVLEWFSKIRFPNRGDELGILFVRSYDGILLMSLSSPNLIGENISDSLDPDSINTHDLFLNTVNNPVGGYAEYSWFNPTTKKIGNKISFVKGIPEWQWYIGAGFWLDDINSIIEQERLVMKNTVESYVRIIILSMLILLIFIYIISSYLSRRMEENFSIFSSFFNTAAIDSAKIDINRIEFSEFEKMASAANSMMNAREQIEKELKISNRIINRSPAVAFMWKNEDNLAVEFVSDNVKYLLGYSAQEFMNGGIKYKKLIHENDLPKVEKEVASYINDEKRKSFSLKPYRLITKTGEIKWVNDNSYIKRDSKGMITHYEGIIYDITELKKTEDKANRFNSIIADSLNEIYLFDSNTLLYTQANNAALENMGYNFDEILKLTPIDIQPEISAKSFEKLVKPLRKKEKKKIIFETTHQRKDKSLYNVEVHLQLLKYESESLFAAIILDIDESKLAKKALLEIQTLNQTLLETSPDLIYIYDIVERKNIYSNEGIMKILGYSVKEIQDMGENLLPSLMHPDDLNFYLLNIIPRYQNAKDGETIENEYRVKHKNGKWTWLLSRESIYLRQDDGSPKQIFGFTSDITGRKKYDKEIIKLNIELEQKIKDRTLELEKKNKDLQKMNKVFIGRELRMKELKGEIAKLKEKGH